MKLKIGIATNISPHGGGTFQYTQNICQGLDSYANKTDSEIIMFCYSDPSHYQKVYGQYPNIKYLRINPIYKFGMKLANRIFVVCPQLVQVLKIFYPLNWLCHKHKISLMIFPGLSCDPSLYRYKQVFFFADICCMSPTSLQ